MGGPQHSPNFMPCIIYPLWVWVGTVTRSRLWQGWCNITHNYVTIHICSSGLIACTREFPLLPWGRKLPHHERAYGGGHMTWNFMRPVSAENSLQWQPARKQALVLQLQGDQCCQQPEELGSRLYPSEASAETTVLVGTWITVSWNLELSCGWTSDLQTLWGKNVCGFKLLSSWRFVMQLWKTNMLILTMVCHGSFLASLSAVETHIFKQKHMQKLCMYMK